MKRAKKFLGFIGVLLLLGFLLEPFAVDKVGGDFEVLTTEYSPETQKIIDSLFSNQDTIHDYHCHLIGVGQNGTGCYVNDNMDERENWVDAIKFDVYLSASGVTDKEKIDEQYIKRLASLVASMPTPFVSHLLAFDKFYNEDGLEDLEKTTFYVPNEYVLKVVKKYPDLFEPCVSIHPYRKGALAELEKYGKMGVKQVKWLPNAMGINPSHEKCIPYYEVMKKYDMTLLSHAGHEQAVHAEELQAFGNPLHLRVPLDMGVKVILAHCGTLGENIDLDNPENGEVSNYLLFLRLMNEDKYKPLLRSDISAISQYNRYQEGFQVLDESEEIKSRLVYGSDYPLPGINFLTRTSSIQKDGFITSMEEEVLNEIYESNPLLFDVVLKKLVRSKSGNKFNREVFLK